MHSDESNVWKNESFVSKYARPPFLTCRFPTAEKPLAQT